MCFRCSRRIKHGWRFRARRSEKHVWRFEKRFSYGVFKNAYRVRLSRFQKCDEVSRASKDTARATLKSRSCGCCARPGRARKGSAKQNSLKVKNAPCKEERPVRARGARENRLAAEKTRPSSAAEKTRKQKRFALRTHGSSSRARARVWHAPQQLARARGRTAGAAAPATPP